MAETLPETHSHNDLEALPGAREVAPFRSLEALRRGWPADELDDGFEKTVREWRALTDHRHQWD